MGKIRAGEIVKSVGRSILALVMILSILVFVTCSKNDKTTDPIPQITDNEELYMELFNSTDADTIEVVVSDSAEINIDITPGIADSAAFILDGQDNFILIPDSALTDSTAISIQCERLRFVHGNDSTLSALVFNCFPDGQVFSESLVFNVYVGYFNNNNSSNAVKMYSFDPDSNRWRLESTKHKNDPRLQFNLTHFSKYAISD